MAFVGKSWVQSKVQPLHGLPLLGGLMSADHGSSMGVMITLAVATFLSLEQPSLRLPDDCPPDAAWFPRPGRAGHRSGDVGT